MSDHAAHFESLEQQQHAARLGMWVFLASEALLFAALFTLFAAYRAEYHGAFVEAVRHNTRAIGSINTGVLLTSSAFVASAVHAARDGRRGATLLRIAATMTLGATFLVLKIVEYGKHIHEGILPGGAGRFFVEHTAPGLASFWTLYWIMTGLHALHVIIGLTVLGTIGVFVARRLAIGDHAHRLEVVAIYWHLVDVVWIFLWPLFYLA